MTSAGSRIMEIEIPKPEQFLKLPEDLRKVFLSLTPKKLSILSRPLAG